MKRSLSKKIVQFFGGVVMAAFVAAISMPVYAMEDGAYTVGRSTSYANPQTGQTVDGGTNIALGDSMCASIVEGSALVEQYQGSTYVTLGIGLMSNITSVRFQIQGADGSYREVAATQTGSCQRDGDTCNHYRIQVDSADLYISPILYVVPMGRDVQFFVKLDTGSATPGSGNFVSEMIPAAPASTAAEPAATTSAAASAKASEGSAAASNDSNTSVVTSEKKDETSKKTDEDTQETTEAEEPETEATETESLVEGTESLMEDTQILEADTENRLVEDTEDAKKTKDKKQKKKSHAPVIAGVVVLLAAGGGTGYWFYRKKRM